MTRALLRSDLRLAAPLVDIERGADGSLTLRSPEALAPHARTVSDWLVRWAAEAPQRSFVAERDGDAWRHVTYVQALDATRRIGQSLVERGLGPDRPLMVLSENSVDHLLLALGAMHVGVPVVPLSAAYSVMSRDFAKLRHIAKLVRPGLVYAGDPKRYAAALDAIESVSTPVAELLDRAPGAAVDEAHAAVGPDSVAKILFTSGSTGDPKGVKNTQRMLTANQQQSLQVWPFLADQPPVVVDWLPWSHTFGGNYNTNMVLSNGGTMYIDAGKPAPGLIETTVRNLREIAPTMYFNVPRGFELLLPHLENDAELRTRFFSRCEFVFYAAAALPQALWERFERLAVQERGGRLALVSAWGATEMAPLCTAVHYPVPRAGVIGLPVPGCELKLVPNHGKLEARIRGPQVFPGYHGRDELRVQAFDEEGFYRTGDALRFVDSEQPALGLMFDGRVAEDFKLRTGTWVHVGALRLKLLACADPLLQDAVITGHDRDEVGALLFLNPATTAGVSPPELTKRLAGALARLAGESGGSSSLCVTRALVMTEPLRPELGEITDKAYVNQRAVLQHRHADVERLYAGAADVVTPGATA